MTIVDVSVPAAFRSATIEDARTGGFKPVYDYFVHEMYRGKDRTGILLLGSVGVGKTHAICGLFNSIAEILGGKGYEMQAIFGMITEVYLVDNLWSFEDKEVSEGVSVKDYALRLCRYLLIDDVGKRNGEYNPSQLQKYLDILGNVLRERYSRKLPTFITSNLGDKEFKDLYGESIWSLVNGCCQYRHMLMDKDRRIRGA